MNKKAISSKIVVMVIGLIVLAILAWIFVPKIIEKTKEGVGFLEQKAGIFTPAGQELAQLEGYTNILLAENSVSLINDAVRANDIAWNWLGTGSEAAYNALSNEKKIEEFYKKAQEIWALHYENEVIKKENPSEKTQSDFKIMKEKLAYAKDYAISRDKFDSLKQPVNDAEASKNKEVLVAVKTEMAELLKKVPADYTLLVERVESLSKSLEDPTECKVSADVCENKLKYYCLLDQGKCAKFDCGLIKNEETCKNTYKCYPVYKLVVEAGEGRFAPGECRSCASAECKNYGDDPETSCNYLINNCKKNCMKYMEGGIFNECISP